MNQLELDRVKKHSKEANYAKGVNSYAIKYCGEVFKRFIVNPNKGGSLLELGPAEGLMTDILYPYFEDYTVVDGADFFIKDLIKRYSNINAINCLFEDFQPNRQYDNIILGHVLEHVENPVEILSKCKTWLTDNGRILSAVPNANSIHRQAAVIMGLLESTKQLNDTDRRNGHRRVYDIETFKRAFNQAGFNIIHCGGYLLKPLSNTQIEKDWTNDMIDAFMKLGEKYPDIAGEIYIVANKRGD